MELVESMYAVTSVVIILLVFAMIYLSVRAYEETSRTAMIHLSLGFVFIIAATGAAVISAFLTGFQGVRSILLVNSGMTACGYFFVLYSLVSFK